MMSKEPKASSQMEGNQATSARKGYDADPKSNPETGAGQPDPKYATGQSSAERAGDPNVPQPPAAPTPENQADKDKDLEPLKRDDAEALLRSGHRLRRKGDDPTNWIAMTRHGNDMGITVAATPDALDHFLSEDLVLAE
jgi:hypothetical protein